MTGRNESLQMLAVAMSSANREMNKSMDKMNASQFCNHGSFRLHSPGGEAFLDSNIKLVRVQFICLGCGRPFRALGVYEGMSIDAPTSDDDGKTTTMPIVPVGEDPEIGTRGIFLS